MRKGSYQAEIGTRVSLVLVVATVGLLLRPPGGWTQQRASPPDTTEALATVLSELGSGERVRLHLAGREPLAAPLAGVSRDSLLVGEEGNVASVSLSRISRLDVGGRAYWKGTILGAAVGAVAGGVIGGFSADWSPDVHHDGSTRPDAGAVALAPIASVTAGIFGGSVAGGVVGLLTGAAITDWEQRYPPP